MKSNCQSTGAKNILNNFYNETPCFNLIEVKHFMSLK